MYEKLLEEMNKVLGPTVRRVPASEVLSEEWDDDLAAFSFAWLATQLGESFLDEALITPDTVTDFGLKVGSFFVPPGFIRDAPFKDRIEIWWDAVKEIFETGKAFSLDKDGQPDVAKPNYGGVVSIWKNKIEAKYGYRPSAAKDKTFAQGIEDGIKQAAAMMRAKKVGDTEVTPEMRSKAARTLQAKKTANIDAAKKLRAAAGE